MEGPISFWGYKEQESNLILPEHDDDDDNWALRINIRMLSSLTECSLHSIQLQQFNNTVKCIVLF